MLELELDSPATVLEGESYTARLTITNRSTKAGLPVGVTLGVGISSIVDGLYLIPEQIANEYFAPNETRTFDYTMVVPSGSGGQSGAIIAWIEDPTGRVLAQDTENVFVEAPPAEYTLEVSIEPPGAGYVTISPSKATYSAGEVVTLTAYPYSGYEFDHWGGWPPYPGIQSTSPTLNLTMTSDWWVVAAFREVAPPPPPPPPPVYTCSYCGAQFATRYERTLHEAVCPNKPAPPPTVYYCPYCSAQFATIDGLYAHIDSVHRGWPW